MQERTPVTLITGFLGAGKSTLINRVLKQYPERRFGIVVNEFGEIRLESAIIDAGVGEVVELSGGCMCCVTRRDLGRALKRLLRYRTQLDRVLLEASGSSNPAPIINTLAKRSIAPQAYLDSVVGVVDLERFPELLGDFEVVHAQIEHSDVVLLSKQRHVGTERRVHVEAAVREIAPQAVIASMDESGELASLFAGMGYEGRYRRELELEQRSVAGHAELESVLFECDAPLSRYKLRGVLAGLPQGLVRAKGFIYLEGRDGRRHKMVLQVVGARRRLEATPWRRDEQRKTALLFLGRGIDEAELRGALAACASATGGWEEAI